MAALKLTASEVKDALRRRHPAFEPGYVGVGRWTTIEEWERIDLLALDAWQSAEVVGYEVKVSRGDFRSELLKPAKRAAAVAMTTRFYFAVPAGLLTDEERAFEQPEFAPDDFKRQLCTNPACTAKSYVVGRGFMRSAAKPRGTRRKGTDREGVTIDLGDIVDRGEYPGGGTYTHHIKLEACCAVCKGYGTLGTSWVEDICPYLWVPTDVGLIVVDHFGIAHVLKESPRRKTPEPILPWPYVAGQGTSQTAENANRIQRQSIAQLARWCSVRPDPRHVKSYTDRITT